jgi:hypothetical protein
MLPEAERGHLSLLPDYCFFRLGRHSANQQTARPVLTVSNQRLSFLTIRGIKRLRLTSSIPWTRPGNRGGATCWPSTAWAISIGPFPRAGSKRPSTFLQRRTDFCRAWPRRDHAFAPHAQAHLMDRQVDAAFCPTPGYFSGNAFAKNPAISGSFRANASRSSRSKFNLLKSRFS